MNSYYIESPVHSGTVMADYYTVDGNKAYFYRRRGWFRPEERLHVIREFTFICNESVPR